MVGNEYTEISISLMFCTQWNIKKGLVLILGSKVRDLYLKYNTKRKYQNCIQVLFSSLFSLCPVFLPLLKCIFPGCHISAEGLSCALQGVLDTRTCLYRCIVRFCPKTMACAQYLC